MATVIRTRGEEAAAPRLPAPLITSIPSRLRQELEEVIERGGMPEELRLRRERNASVSRRGKNFFLRTVLTGAEMDAILLSLCDGSLYAHRDTISKGFLTLSGGVRVGLVGRAVVEEEQVVAVYDVSGINLRLPRRIPSIGRGIVELLRRQEPGKGLLVYAPPGGGKTTLLRGMAAVLASGDSPLRVCLVDTREELSFSLEDRRLCLDVLRGYPRPLGIEIATRTMNAQLIVCDEIGEREEAEAIRDAQNCGVPFLASAHGNSVEGLLRREGLLLLHRAEIFGAYVGISRRSVSGEPEYRITSWKEAEEYVASGGRAAFDG